MKRDWTHRQALIHLRVMHGADWPLQKGVKRTLHVNWISWSHRTVCAVSEWARHTCTCDVPVIVDGGQPDDATPTDGHVVPCPGGAPVYQYQVGTARGNGYTREQACRSVDLQRHMRGHPCSNACEERARLQGKVTAAIPKHWLRVSAAYLLEQSSAAPDDGSGPAVIGQL